MTMEEKYRELAVDILKAVEVGLTEHFIKDILRERIEDETTK